MKIKITASVTAVLAIAFGLVVFTPISATPASAAGVPEMCNGRSDPNLHIVAQATTTSANPGYFLSVTNDDAGNPTGTLILDQGSPRLVVTDWCRAWQHIPGVSESGCGEPYPQGAITAHAVGEARLDGQGVLVRTDVRKLADGQMLYRVRYRPMSAAETTEGDNCEAGWIKIPAEGWYPLNQFRVQSQAGPAGYWLAGADGGVFSLQAPFHGSLAATHLNAPIVGMALDPITGGYWLVAADGGVFSFGGAPFHGSLAATHLNAPIVGMALDPITGHGYWLVAADGGVFTFGDARFYGSMGTTHLNAPIVDMTPTPSGHGYWLVAADGGVFTFGDARFYGSMGTTHLNAPIVGMTSIR